MFIFAYIIAIFFSRYLSSIYLSITQQAYARIGHTVVLQGGV
jgi:hypothetical protein